MKINPPLSNISLEQTFQVNINIEPSLAIAGVQFDLSFNPSLLSVTSVLEGNFLSQNGASTYFSPGTINNVSGTITGVAGAITTPGQTITSTETFAVINFRVKENTGITLLELSNVVLGDINGIQIPVTVFDGSVHNNVSKDPTGDTDNNNTINVLDITGIVRMILGLQNGNPEADVDNNGIIDTHDIDRLIEFVLEIY